MANGDIGRSMAQKTIHDLLVKADARKDTPALAGHCPDHAFQSEVNYALLLGMDAILSENGRAAGISMFVSAVTTGVVFALLTFFSK